MSNNEHIFIFRGNEVLVEAGTDHVIRQKPVMLDDAAISDYLDEKTRVPPALYSIAVCSDTPAPEGTEWRLVRRMLAVASESVLQPMLKALALLHWRLTAHFCGKCGAPTEDKSDEVARLCPTCGFVTFPRLSPAILAVVRKDNQILLASNAKFTTGVFSLVAGYLEVGENFEECVRREVLEETGIEVDNIAYVASQPWPFPDALMVGFEATWKSGEIKPDGVEILQAGWFGPDNHPPLPPPGSLSRKLIDRAFLRSARTMHSSSNTSRA
jgi:NAD+ diphosphatase